MSTKVGGREILEKEVCEGVRNDLKVEKEEFLNCTIKPGSIQVDFVLFQNDYFRSHTLRRLNVMVQSNIFNLVIDGTKLTSLASSVYRDGVHQADSGPTQPPPNNPGSSSVDEDDDGWMVAIVILILIIIIVLIVLVILLLMIKKRKEETVCSYFLFNITFITFIEGEEEKSLVSSYIHCINSGSIPLKAAIFNIFYNVFTGHSSLHI